MNRLATRDMRFYKHLVGRISLFAIKKVEVEWIQIISVLPKNKDLGEYGYWDILQRFSLLLSLSSSCI